MKTESSEEQVLVVSSQDGEYCSKGIDRSRYCKQREHITISIHRDTSHDCLLKESFNFFNACGYATS